MTVPEARVVIMGIVIRVSGVGTMVPGVGVALARAEILHYARELFDAFQYLGVVQCWGYPRE
jgi:hypothetical protein